MTSTQGPNRCGRRWLPWFRGASRGRGAFLRRRPHPLEWSDTPFAAVHVPETETGGEGARLDLGGKGASGAQGGPHGRREDPTCMTIQVRATRNGQLDRVGASACHAVEVVPRRAGVHDDRVWR